MQRYRYRAIEKDGSAREGEALAQSEEDLLEKLRQMELTVLNIDAVSESPEQKLENAEIKIEIDTGVTQKVLTFFTRQLAITLSAGIPLTRIFATLYNQSSSKSMKKVLKAIGNDLQQGTGISDSMKKHPDVFDSLYISMIAVGETSGTLPGAVTRLAELMERNARILRKVRAALTYPVFIIIFSAVLAYVLLAMVLPGFEPVFKSTGMNIEAEYPLTSLLLKLSAAITNPVLVAVLIGAVIILIITVKWMGRTRRGSYIIDSIKFNLPFLSPLIKISSVTRFCRGFATLSESGVPLLKALSLVGKASGNLVVDRAVEKIASDIQEGSKLSEAMKRSGIFPDLVIQMVSIGEEAGTLPEMLERTADYFDSELESTIESVTALLEPAMMIFVGFIVGIFVMGILLPIMGITSRL